PELRRGEPGVPRPPHRVADTQPELSPRRCPGPGEPRPDPAAVHHHGAILMRRLHGFTLVELLVALFVLALLASLSWRGLDSMIRTREQTEARADEILTLQTGLAQWA